MQIPDPIFKDKLPKISWKKIYAREYGVQYSEMAIMCLTDKARHHIPKTSVNQIVIPEEHNTAFYIDAVSWVELVESLNNRYTLYIKKLEKYEEQFIHDGKDYLETAKRVGNLNLKSLTDKELKIFYQDYKDKLFLYSIFAWTAFILNNYVAERAINILNGYIKRAERENEKQAIYDALFRPAKRAAVLQLQDEVRKHRKLSNDLLEDLYERFKWLSCLDLHNRPWTKGEFREHIKSFTITQPKKKESLTKVAEQLKIEARDLEYLLMAKRFVYIKDARDDYRRQGVFYALRFFKELARRMNIDPKDISFLQASEILAFLDDRLKISKQVISKRKKGFVLYLDVHKKLVCLHGREASKALKAFRLLAGQEKFKEIAGRVASKGVVSGRVVIVRGVKDLDKVEKGDILIAVETHPDYVPAMRKAVAIVTDEGGLTGHAAIVSREFGIPCIVGTKNATLLLQDGDIVEVNAEKGIVKKSENKNEKRKG